MYQIALPPRWRSYSGTPEGPSMRLCFRSGLAHADRQPTRQDLDRLTVMAGLGVRVRRLDLGEAIEDHPWGAIHSRALARDGVVTVAQLAETDPVQVAEVLGIDDEHAERLVHAARVQLAHGEDDAA